LNRELRLVIVGGSGQVGNILARHFHALRHHVTVISRSAKPRPWRVVPWDGTSVGAWTAELEHANVLINLAGRNVNCRYSDANRREIRASRVQTTRLLGQALGKLTNPPRLWMNASTATIYRHSLDRAMDEETGEIGGNEPDAPSSWRFSIDVATRWEEAFFAAVTPQIRRVALRGAVIMSPDAGGIFDTLLRFVRLGLGGKAGTGRQFVSWIHEKDFCNAVDFLIEHDELSGVVNLAAPNPLPNRDFMRDLRRAWGTRIGIPANALMLELGAVFLRTETELVLKSRRVVPGRLLHSGFRFQFSEWSAAAQDLVSQWRNKRSGQGLESIRQQIFEIHL
jgi:uncharacterized protein